MYLDFYNAIKQRLRNTLLECIHMVYVEPTVRLCMGNGGLGGNPSTPSVTL